MPNEWMDQIVKILNLYYDDQISHTTALARINLVSIDYKEDFEMLSDSLKVLQYAYAGLPMVMPDYLDSSRNNVYFYRPGCVETIRQSIEQAFLSKKNFEGNQKIRSWDEIVSMWIERVGLQP